MQIVLAAHHWRWMRSNIASDALPEKARSER
jgi:hypothetical protein